MESLRILIPSLLPLASLTDLKVDLAAHIGGTLTGAAVAFCVLKSWSEHSPLPPGRQIAAALSIAGLIGILFGFGAIASHYPAYKQRMAMLIPKEEIVSSSKDLRGRSPDLLRRYPDDPRAHLMRGQAFMEAGDLIDARYEMEAALPLAEKYRDVFGPQLENVIRIALALIWNANGAHAQAVKITKPACDATGADRPDDKLYDDLGKFRLCE